MALGAAMIDTLERLDLEALGAFDDIIDVRSPGEYAEDHMPGAINLPVLDDAERAEVGTIYVQQSPFLARRIGAALVARNIARHLETALADRSGGYRPLIYCWRGGQRSNAMATVLRQVGWRAVLVAGGYRTWRRHVTASLYDAEPCLKVVLLDGNTGSAKTEILNRLPGRGIQVLDLEGLAGHRGSVFGGLSRTPQPSQKAFESRLMGALADIDPARPVVVEAESSKIGDRMIPPVLWKAMQAAPRLSVKAEARDRVQYLVQTYAEITSDSEALGAALDRLPPLYGRQRLAEWVQMARSGDFSALAAALIEIHYDPAYERSNRRDTRPTLGDIIMSDLGESGQEAAADQITDLVQAI
ncbi:MAG: tRNA 2-selenouridine(34) synthase MnmH [Caulobacter sp.]|nr:tRNA 2-selenouridine(34) synthase MnmH [Caulobacter sp.]